MKCPKCKSKNIEEDDSADFILGLTVLNVPASLGLSEHEFRCNKCDYNWEE